MEMINKEEKTGYKTELKANTKKKVRAEKDKKILQHR